MEPGMIRLLSVAVLASALLPASAEAAKFRFGGSRSHNSHASENHRDGSHVVVTPALRARQNEKAAAGQASRPATPAAVATAGPVALRSAEPSQPGVWCRSQVVVGGFCVLN
jgi:hypothetical protein